MKATTVFLVLFTIMFNFVVVKGSINKSLYQAPDECRWSGYNDNDITLICKLRTINSELEKTNFSVIQSKNTIRLRLECNDGLFFQSSLTPGSLKMLDELVSLSIEYCKLGSLVEGSFKGLKDLRNLTIRTHNSDWSSMSLEISSRVFHEVKHLEYLDISENNMWNIPDGMLCSVQSLSYLNLTRNRIRDTKEFYKSDYINSNCGDRVKIVDLSYNKIDNLPSSCFVKLKNLTELYLQNNGLTFIEDHAFTNLKYLSTINLSDNNLKSLPPEIFMDTKLIKNIFLQNNTIDVLAPGIFSELIELIVLNLSHNKLTTEWINSITFQMLKKLVILDISYNKLVKLETNIFRDLVSLEILKIQNNLIEQIANNTFEKLINLHTLQLSNNKIKIIESQSFNGLNQLSLLSLENNDLSRIHTNALKNCSNLQDLHLNRNKLLSVPMALYDVTYLKTLDLGENHIQDIDNASFMEMNQIFGLRLTDNNIERIKYGTFHKMKSLQILNLSRNKISRIDQGSLDENRNLQAIRFDGNYLQDISGLFTKLTNLVWLNISDNQLEIFDYSMIPTGLQWLDLHSNKISDLGNHFEIESDLSLSTLDVSSNRLTEITSNEIPNSIELLYLNDNLITKVQSYTFFKKPNLTKVDLFGNKITTLDSNSLRLSTVPDNKSLPEFYIGGNPYECDCNLDWLQKTNIDSRTQPKLMDLDSIYCKLLYNRGKNFIPLVEALSNQFLCKYDVHCFTLCNCCDYTACDCKMECPKKCSCYRDLSWSSNVVDCSLGGYDDKLPINIPIDATQIYLDGNYFKNLTSHQFIGRKKLKTLFLNNSEIEIIQNRTFFGLKEIELLHLNHNNLRAINGYEFDGLIKLKELYLHYNIIEIIEMNAFINLNNLETLRLDHNKIIRQNLWNLNLPMKSLQDLRIVSNPSLCNCTEIMNLRDFMNRFEFITDREEYKCIFNETTDEHISIFNENSTRICDSQIEQNHLRENITKTILHHVENDNFIPFLMGTIFGFLFIIILILLVFILRQKIRIWLHYRFGIRLFNNQNYIDKNERDKLFDAFLTYSSKDEQFVIEELATKLENGDKKFKLCLNYRDFNGVMIGNNVNYISDTIVQAIDTSRRTIMILSDNFIKSEWCRFEFKTAHHQVLKDRKKRLIVILYGDIPDKDLDPDIRLYLKTNTYIKWGDKLFWEKLKYSLPDITINSILINNRTNLTNHNVNRHNIRNFNVNNQIMLTQTQQHPTSGFSRENNSSTRNLTVHI